MSRLVKCVTCSGKVSTNANFCPHCGEVDFLPPRIGGVDLIGTTRSSGRIATRAAVVAFAIIVVVVTAIFPPWAQSTWKVSQHQERTINPIEEVDRHYAGIGSILDPKWGKTFREEPTAPGAIFEETAYHINIPILLLEWLILLTPTLIILVLLRDRPKFRDDLPEEETPEPGQTPAAGVGQSTSATPASR
jgi:hypothetical protein